MSNIKSIFLIAGNTVTGVLRGVILNVLLILAAILILGSMSTAAFKLSDVRYMLIDSGLAVISMLGALIAILTGFNMIQTETESRTIYTVLSKPVARWQYLLGKYFGAIGINAITVGLLSILFFMVYLFKAPGHTLDVRLIPAVFMIFAVLCVLSAIIMFLSTFMSWIGTIIVATGFWFIGSYSQFLYDMAMGGGGSEFGKRLILMIQKLLPNFQSMDLRYQIVQQEVAKIDWQMVDKPLAGGLLYIAICLILAIIIFNYREL